MLKTLGLPVSVVVSRVNSLQELFSLSREAMITFFGEGHGKKLYEFCNKNVFS